MDFLFLQKLKLLGREAVKIGAFLLAPRGWPPPNTAQILTTIRFHDRMPTNIFYQGREIFVFKTLFIKNQHSQTDSDFNLALLSQGDLLLTHYG
jgi:hypothetical protein